MRPETGKKRDFRNRRRGIFNNSQNSQREKSEENKVAMHKCGICSQDIRDLSSAIALPEGSPAHFDCVLNKVKESENLRDKEQIVYLGSGSFGIVQNSSNNQSSGFKIIKKIDFEERGNMPEWRKQMLKVKI